MTVPTKLKNVLTKPAGWQYPLIFQGTVTNVNATAFSVDIRSQFDRKFFLGIQCASPYLHHSNGEGIYILPEVGATVMGCVAGDSSPPFILAYVMPPETVNGATDDAPNGTSSNGGSTPNATTNTFAGGRPPCNPGDIWLRTRDNNFVILRRGGTLQVGTTPLAQRIYIPLNNLITDISQNYEHHNSNGSVVWGIQEGAPENYLSSSHTQTFRVFAGDQYADVRITCGDVTNPLPDPDGGVAAEAAGLGVGDDGKGANPILFEIAVSPKGFVAESGSPVNTQATVAACVLRFAFDRQGNALLRTSGSLSLNIKQKLTIAVESDISVTTQGGFQLEATNGVLINGGDSTEIQGRVIRLNGGTYPIARQYDSVMTSCVPASPWYITFMSPVPVVGSPSGPWSITPGASFPCTVGSSPGPKPGPLAGQITNCAQTKSMV